MEEVARWGKRERERETRLWRLLAQLRELERPFNKSLAPGYRLFQPFEWKNNKVDRGWMHNGTRGRGMGRNGENKMEKRRREAVETLEERVLLFFKLIINAWLSIRESRVTRHQSWHESYFPRVSWLTLFDWSPPYSIETRGGLVCFAASNASNRSVRGTREFSCASNINGDRLPCYSRHLGEARNKVAARITRDDSCYSKLRRESLCARCTRVPCYAWNWTMANELACLSAVIVPFNERGNRGGIDKPNFFFFFSRFVHSSQEKFSSFFFFKNLFYFFYIPKL